MRWTLPSRPDAHEYQELERWLADLKKQGREDDYLEVKRSVAEQDLWYFHRHVSTFGSYLVDDPGHSLRGRPWPEHPFVFELSRLRQKHHETGKRDVWICLPRFHFKTALVTVGETAWKSLKNPKLTTAVISWKLEGTGLSIVEGFSREFLQNKEVLALWPEVTVDAEELGGVGKKARTKASGRTITLLRPLGPKEPTISLFSILSSAVGGHFDRIVADDVVTDETMLNESGRGIKRVVEKLRLLTALEKDNSEVVFVNNRWGINDPYSILESEDPGFFGERIEYSGIRDNGEPLLRSRAFVDRWRTRLGPYHFAAQLLNRPIPRSSVCIDETVIRDSVYELPPAEEAKQCTKLFFVDPRGVSDSGDDYAYAVVGLHEDRSFRVLDLCSEFGPPDQMYKDFCEAILKWGPLFVWVEEIGASAHSYSLQQELKLRNMSQFAHRVRTIPPGATHRNKEQRIEILSNSIHNREWRFPQGGVGHGTRSDKEDSFKQWLRREVKFWSADRTDQEDHILDCLAWPVQPELRTTLPWKRPPGGESTKVPRIVQNDPDLRQWLGLPGSAKRISWRVA
jgi:hypothetical protein